MSDLLHQLSEPFPGEVERTLTKGGARLTYIPVSEVISRLNNVIGVENWSFEVRGCSRDTLNPDWVIAHVRITAVIDGCVVNRDGFGGQEVKRKKSGDILDLGDEHKGAMSDALKKAAQGFGVGLYLARSEEALGLEAAADATPVAPAAQSAWDNFVSLAGSLNDEQRENLNQFWKEFSEDRPKPNIQSITDTFVADLTSLSQEAVRLSFSATATKTDA